VTVGELTELLAAHDSALPVRVVRAKGTSRALGEEASAEQVVGVWLFVPAEEDEDEEEPTLGRGAW
jgi:hypothetical protein